MENKDFWNQFLKSGSMLSADAHRTTADTASAPGNRAKDPPTTPKPSEKRNLDLDAILKDIRQKTEAEVNPPSRQAVPDRSAEVKPTTIYQPEKQKLDIDAILKDIRQKTADEEETSAKQPTAQHHAETRPTAPSPPQKRDSDIDALFQDILRQATAEVNASDGQTAAQPEKSPTVSQNASMPSDTFPDFSEEEKGGAPASNRAVTPPNQPPASLTDSFPSVPSDMDQDAMLEMTAAMKALTAELHYLRTGLQTDPKDTASEAPKNTSKVDKAVSKHPTVSSTPQTAAAEEVETKKKNKTLSIISSILFYTVIVAMVLGAFLIRSTNKGQPFMLGGFSAANILTSSMEDVYPKGCMIVTKQVDAKELMIGDDITFMVSEDTSITHRIIGITENYLNTGQRAFETKGTMNPNPDKDMVAAANVVGKVIFHSKLLGNIANFVKANWPILIFILLVIIGLITFLKWNAKRSDGEEDDKEDKPPDSKSKQHSPKNHKKENTKQWQVKRK